MKGLANSGLRQFGTGRRCLKGKSVSDRLDQLSVGQSDVIARTITSDDVVAFARLSGDYNALHVDDEFAARTEFGGRVVHGFLHASLLSTLIGMKIPGPGALYLSQSIDFSAPVFIGDTVEARGRIERIDRETRVVEIETEITNQNGAQVLKGKARAKVLRLPEPSKDVMKRPAPSLGRMLEGRTALVTGASRGIGRATARLLASAGAHVWINYHSSRGAAVELAEEIRQAGASCDLVRADIAIDQDVEQMFRQICNVGGLDILINNAGPKIQSAPFDRVTWQDIESAHRSIVGGTFNVTKAALPRLRESKGTIVTVLTSASLQRTAHHWLPYVAAKSALHAMMKNLAQEVGPSGVNVNMVSPSIVDTDLVAGTPERLRQMMVARTPMRRMATVDDVAGAILILVSPFARFVTGENLLVTGGDVMI
ncbi:MAG: SDR family oxidoreductase [Hyphomicrobiaceae bacterium]|nr:SDR family oxidoreductase [Hyphomicrobiaceae bacterium]